MLTGDYQKHKEKLRKEARERYQNLSEEEKYKKRQYARERYRNLSEEEIEKKHQYGDERYENLLGDENRKDYLRLSEDQTFFIISTLGWSIEYKKDFLGKYKKII